MERLVELTTSHHFTRNGMRTNVDTRPENRARAKNGREWLRRGPYSNTVREGHPIVEQYGYPLRRRVPEQAPGQ